ncbi:MAG: DUF167 domain-containing protein [Gammaproteobacteria bacterium]
MSERFRLEVYIQPGSKKSEIAGKHDGRLKIRIKSPPEDGRANKEIITFVSKWLGIKKQDVSIIAGEKSRFKTLAVTGSVELPLKKLACK